MTEVTANHREASRHGVALEEIVTRWALTPPAPFGSALSLGLSEKSA